MSHLETKTLEISQDVKSATIAYDYWRGAIRRHFETFLSRNITEWEKRKVNSIWVELLREIVEKSSHTYNDSPKRQILDSSGEVDEAKSTAYHDIISDQEFGFIPMQDEFDQIRRLLQSALVLVTYSNEAQKITYDILSRHNSEVKYNRVTKQIEELLYTSGAVGPNGGKMFHLWTTTELIDIERSDSGEKVVGRQSHEYGIVPVAYAYDVYTPLYSFWPAARWETLITLNNAVSLSHTETGFASRFQKFPQLFTDVKIPEGTLMAPDTIVEIKRIAPDIEPYLEFKAPPNIQQSIEAFGKWIDNLITSVGGQWGVNIDPAGSGSAESGFQLIVEELPNLEIRVKRIGTAQAFEARLHAVTTVVAGFHNLGDISGDFKADFGEPKLPVNKKEDAEITTMKLAAGVWDLEDAWRHDNPEITEEQIKEKRARIDAKQLGRAAGVLPTFEEA